MVDVVNNERRHRWCWWWQTPPPPCPPPTILCSQIAQPPLARPTTPSLQSPPLAHRVQFVAQDYHLQCPPPHYHPSHPSNATIALALPSTHRKRTPLFSNAIAILSIWASVSVYWLPKYMYTTDCDNHMSSHAMTSSTRGHLSLDVIED